MTPVKHAQPAWSRGLDRCDNADGFENVWLPAEEALALAAEIRRLGALDAEHYPERLEHAIAALEAQAARVEELERKLAASHEATRQVAADATAERDAALAQWKLTLRQYRELSAQLEAAREALRRAAYVAEHLMQMIDPETWRLEGGDDMQGHYEGDYRAARLAEEIKEWAALAGVDEPAKVKP